MYHSSYSKRLEIADSEYEKYNDLLKHNKHYVKLMTDLNPDYFKNLSDEQNPNYLLIGCSDSRVPPNTITETKPGEIFVHRNIANQVHLSDFSVNSVIQYAVEHLKVKHIIICGHTKCGGCSAAYSKEFLGGMLDMWLSELKEIINQHKVKLSKIEDENMKLTEISRLNVIQQVHNAWKIPYVQEQWQLKKPIYIHGWMYHIETGHIEEIVKESSLPEELRCAYELIFKKEV